MTSRTRITAFGAIVLLIVGGIAAYVVSTRDSKGRSTATVAIAGNIPLSGPVAAWSGQYPNGFTMGIDEACDRFAVPRDSIQVSLQDNAGNPRDAVSLFQQQQLKGFDVYISGTSECSLAVGPLVDKTGVPHFTLAFDPFYTADGPNRFRIQPNSRLEGPWFVKYAKFKNAKKIYMLNVNSAYANHEWDRIIEPGLKHAGIDSNREAYDFNQRDFKTIALKVEQYNPDLIFAIGYSFHLQPLIRDLRARALVAPGRFMSALDFVDFLYQDLPRADLLDVVFACPSFEIPGKVPGAKEWKDRYFQRFGRKPTYVEAYGFDAAGVLVKTYKDKGKITTQTILESMPYEGITGTVTLNDDRDLNGTITLARVNKDGVVEEVKLVPE